MLSLLAISLGSWLGGGGGGGGGGHSDEVANGMAMSGFALERPWLALGGLFLSSYAHMCYGNSRISHLAGLNISLKC